MSRTILTLNRGSSSLKVALFRADGTRRTWHYRERESERAFEAMARDLDGEIPFAIGHRFVHGGEVAEAARVLDAAEVARLRTLVPLAPLHLPGNLDGVEWCRAHFNLPQVACFDTAFHHTLPTLARRLPIPSALSIRRYGFHGLNYDYIASHLEPILGALAHGKVVVAHLGSGASLCLLDNLQSVDTTMGWTPAGGIPMGTRSGDLDPGVMLELAQRYEGEALSDLVYRGMGLLALSEGESSEMAALLESHSAEAAFAVEYFCREVRAAIGAMAAKAGSIDALIFSGGIGEHAPKVRSRVCEPLRLLGFWLDETANQGEQTAIHAVGSKPVLRIAADEEEVIRAHVERVFDSVNSGGGAAVL